MCKGKRVKWNRVQQICRIAVLDLIHTLYSSKLLSVYSEIPILSFYSDVGEKSLFFLSSDFKGTPKRVLVLLCTLHNADATHVKWQNNIVNIIMIIIHISF